MYLVQYLCLFIVFSRIIPLLPSVSISLYYSCFGIISLFLLVKNNGIRVNMAMSLFILTIFVSILLNDIPSFFQPWQRAISFCLIIISTGPLLQGKFISLFKEKLFLNVINIIRAITVLSFLGYLLRLPVVANTSGFCGLTAHSMTMGPFAAISMLLSSYLYLERKNNLDLGLSVISLLTCLLAGSRAALGGAVIGLVYLIWRYNKGNIMLFIKYIVISSFLILVSSPIWKPYSASIEEKQKNNIEAGSTFASREGLWENRLAEFYSSPLYGIGFASLGIKETDTFFNQNTGVVEPGSSWLFLLSSLGIMGGIFMLILIFAPLSKSTSTDSLYVSFKYSIALFFIFHMFFEGYVISSGGFLFFMLWLTLSVCNTPYLFIPILKTKSVITYYDKVSVFN